VLSDNVMSLTENIVMCLVPQPPFQFCPPSLARRMKRARRWVRFAAGRWRPIPPRIAWCDWNWSVLLDSLLWSTFDSAVRAANDPVTEAIGVIVDGCIVPVSPAVVLQIAAGDNK